MSMRDDFEGIVSDWLDDKAGRGAPDYADEILARTSETRQRPAWSSLERWLPMQSTLRFAPVPRLGWVLLIALAVVAAIGIAVLAAGSRSTHVPPPFGPARNGAILYAGIDHDIYALDPVTGVTTALITGSAGDHSPLLSPDGRKVLFLRDTDDVPATLGPDPMVMVANADGSGVRPLTGALAGFTEAAWSHDGSKVAVVSTGARSHPALRVLTVDGSSEPVVIDTHDRTGITYVSFRPGDRELTFRGSNSDGDRLSIVAADGSDYWSFLATEGDGASLSPDGTKLAFQVWDGTLGTIHVVDVDTEIDSVPALDPPSDARLVDDKPTWSPDGTQLLFVRYAVGSNNHLVVAPAAGGARVQIGPAMPNCGCAVSAEFSPDGSKVLAHYSADGSTWLLDPTGATAGTQLSATIAETATWQRKAP